LNVSGLRRLILKLVLLLIDPPLVAGSKDFGKVMLVGHSHNTKAESLYATQLQGGYVDFILFWDSKGYFSSMISIMSDLCHYLAKYSDQLDRVYDSYE
jgi:hypothetical protein